MSTEVILYHYHPETKVFSGTSVGRLSPLDLKYGRKIVLKPPDTTEIKPTANYPKQKNGWFEMYFDVNNQKWKFRNTEIVYRLFEKEDGMGLVYPFVKSGDYVLIERFRDIDNTGYWCILYCFTPDEPFWTEIHTADVEWSKEVEATYEDLIFEIAIIEGRADPKNLDNPVTQEEERESEQYWDQFKSKNIDEIQRQITEKEKEIIDNFPVLISAEVEKAMQYKQTMETMIVQEKEDSIKLLEQKKLVLLAIMRKKIAKVLESATKARVL